jgi:hypothetical protein
MEGIFATFIGASGTVRITAPFPMGELGELPTIFPAIITA